MPRPIPSVFLRAGGTTSSSSRLSSSSAAGSSSQSLSSPSSSLGQSLDVQRPHLRLRRPRTIAELATLADKAVEAMPFSPGIPVHRYLTGAENLVRQADAYSNQAAAARSNAQRQRAAPSEEALWILLEEEWVSLVKAARLLLEILPSKHPGWAKLDSEMRRKAKMNAEDVLERIGKLKVQANDQFEAWRANHPDARLDDDPEWGGESQDELVNERNYDQIRKEQPRGPRSLELKGKRSAAGSGGFDVRDMLGTSPFTSSPLEPFNGSHSKMPSPKLVSTPWSNAKRDAALSAARAAVAAGGAGSRIPEKYSYPILKASNTYRMSAHQATQGFAASTRLAGNYYSTTIASSSTSSPSPSSNTTSQGATARPRDGGQQQVRPTIPSKYELRPSLPSKVAMPAMQLAAAPALAPDRIAMPTPAPSASASEGFRESLPRDASLRNLHHYERKLSPRGVEMAAGGLVRSQSRIALEVKNLLSQQQASEPGSKHAQATATQARTEGGESLRNLRVPASIIDHFVAIAYENTLANRETCGLLMGPARNLTDPNATSLVVTHLTIPKQSATPDTCTTEHEEEIMQFQDEAQVVTLGWIHTHPSQTCFMSSLDLHTHASYQMMLPEAIAIVCAPNDNPSFGLFRLTSPPGLQTVISCRQPGLFHPHIKPDGTNIPALYTDAWGHVTLEQADQLEIVDLRTR